MIYDYLIIGAGSSGAALAGRLSEHPGTTVLLLEAGPDYRASDAPRAMQIPNPHHIIGRPEFSCFRYDNMLARRSRWQEPSLYWRGRGLGGSSAINGQIAIRGMLEDFDIWAEQGCTGWSGAEILPEFNRLEDDPEFGDRPYHGVGGPIPIYRAPKEKWGPVDRAFCEAALALGYPWADDHNAPGSTGVSPYAIDNRDDVRVSTYDGYLEPARDRRNLTIIGDALVTHLTFDGKRATGAAVLTAGGERTFQARETIVACGAIHSPGVLIRSGIGPADDVRALGIEPLVGLPVGKNLCDHSAVSLRIAILPEHRVTTTEHRHTNCCLRYSSGYPGTGLNDMFMASTNLSGYRDEALERGGIVVATYQTFSKGTVRVRTLDAAVDPEIEINMLDDERDLVRLREGYRLLLTILRQDAIGRISSGVEAVDGGSFPDESASDDEVDGWLRTNCADTQHPVGTCRMGAADDRRSVVDPDCRVIGVEDLRVIDASIMPENVRANTHLSTVAIAEQMAARLAG